jgi:hypothetical protein
MLKKLLILLIAASGLCAGEKKYNLSICCLFKNEAKYLKEWIEYHKMVGVDHFYLYNNGSTDGFHRVLNPYIKQGVVTLINWPDFMPNTEEEAWKWALSTQVSAYENAAKYVGINETKWLVFVEGDEFLVPPESTTLAEVLIKYDDYPGITLASDYFDASKSDALPQKKLIIETVELTSAPAQNIQKTISKTIFKPEEATGFIWPPYQCCFKKGETVVTLRKKELKINCYTNRNKGYQRYFEKQKEKLAIDTRMLSEDEKTTLLNQGYELEDSERPILRFTPDLRRKLGYAAAWESVAK